MGKRGGYTAKVHTYPSHVEPPKTPEENLAHQQRMDKLKQQVKRWEKAGNQSENIARANAFWQVLDASRSRYRAGQDPETRRLEASVAEREFSKFGTKIMANFSRDMQKWLSMGQEGFAMARDASSTEESITEHETLAKEVFEDIQQPAEKKPKRVSRVQSFKQEKKDLEAETERKLRAIAAGKASAPMHIRNRAPFFKL